jgi:hypothetical protein
MGPIPQVPVSVRIVGALVFSYKSHLLGTFVSIVNIFRIVLELFFS